MEAAETQVLEARKGFENLSEEELEAHRQQVASGWTSLYHKAEAAKRESGDAAPVSLLAAEEREKAKAFREEYDNVLALQKAAAPVPPPLPVREPTDLTGSYDFLKGKALDALVKRDAQCYRDLMKAGRNKFDGASEELGYFEHPGEVQLGQNLIARDHQSGYNKVLPIPFVSAAKETDSDEEAYIRSLEASFRYGEILQADKAHEFDARTGNRLSRLNYAAQLQAQQAETSDINLTSVGGDLYAEMVRQDTFMSVIQIKQTPNLNPYKATGRTGIPVFGAFNEAGDIMDTHEDTWRAIDVDFKKYAGIMQYTHETTQVESAWSMAGLIAMDAGLALRNGFNRDLLVGAAGGNTLDGFLTTIKATAAYRTTGVANANFLRGTDAFKVPQLARLTTDSIPKEYLMTPTKRLVMQLATWGKLMALVDGDGRKLLRDSNQSVEDLQLGEYMVRITIDDNLDAGTATGHVPFIFGDMNSLCAILAGGPRMDFSTEYAFRSDRLALRCIQHIGSAIVDTKGFKGYSLA